MDDNKNEMMIVDEPSLRNKIYVIRSQQVMLDSDLAGFTDIRRTNLMGMYVIM